MLNLASADVPPGPVQEATPAAAAVGVRRATRRLAAYITLTKPRIIELLLVTTIPVMILAADGLPSLGLVLATLVGGSAAAGAANTLNSVIDRDIDRVMNRTRRRPLATGEITVGAGLVFAAVLGLGSVVWFALLVNALSAVLAASAIGVYVIGYTMILKRRTPQNIVWGGAAGCIPVLIGWSSVTGTLDWAPVALFAVVFFWTPPHYWPLSMRFKNDYAQAGVPMLPVVATSRRVAAEMVGYTVAMVVASLALVPLADMTIIYTVVAAASGLWFGWQVVALLLRSGRPGARLGEMRVFHYSITYLTVLFAAVAADPFWPL